MTDEQEKGQIWYKGTMKTCLWYREHPSSGQESGPPIPNYYIEFYGGGGRDEVLGDGFTDQDGCISIYFESAWPGSVLSVGFRTHNGSVSKFIYPSDSNQTVDFAHLSMDSLPRKYFQSKYDCSECASFYIDTVFNATSSSPGQEQVPLEEHSCASNNWGFDCCGYDWNSHRCGVQQFFPSFQFLHECSGCPTIQYEDDDDDDDDDEEESPPPVDCSTCDKYYPRASSMETPPAERGELYSLTHHACTHEDQNEDSRFGSSCCAYDYKTEQCGILEFDQSYVYLHDKNKGRFLYPCGGTCKSNNGLLGTIGIIVGAAFILFLVVLIYLRRRYLLQRSTNNDDNHLVDNRQETKKKKDYLNEQNMTGDDTYSHPVAPSAPPTEDDDEVVVVATPIFLVQPEHRSSG